MSLEELLEDGKTEINNKQGNSDIELQSIIK
jgi:hypothetical protein